MQQPFNTDPREQPNYASTTNFAPPDPQGAFGPSSAYMQPAASGPAPYPVPYVVQVPVAVPVPAQNEAGYSLALTSLVLGVVGLANIPIILIPVLGICGVPLGLTLSTLGIIFGTLGLRSIMRRRMAIVGIVLSAIPLALMIVLAVVFFLGLGQ